MDTVRKNIAANIVKLRTNAKLTQAELAEKLSYSDKSVSKWERAESVPDIYVLNTMAEMFGVTVDYFLQEHKPEEKIITKDEIRNKNHKVITLISILGVLLLVTVAFTSIWATIDEFLWISYIIAIPIICVLLLVFNTLWFNRHNNMYIISGLVWSLLTTVYLSLLVFADKNLWLLFVIGIPAQIVVLLCFGFVKSGKTK